MASKRPEQRGGILGDPAPLVISLLAIGLAVGASQAVQVAMLGCVGALVFILLGSAARSRWHTLRLTRAELRALAAHLDDVRNGYRVTLPAGVTPDAQVMVADLVLHDDLYVEPPWGTGRSAPPHPHLSRALATAATRGDTVLLVGDPGQGKTVGLQRTFAHLADAFSASPRSAPFPILLPLRELGRTLDRLEDDHDLAEALVAATSLGRSAFPLPAERLRVLLRRRNSVVLLLDGLDEFGGQRITEDLLARLHRFLEHPLVLSCRRAFYDSEVHAQPIYPRLTHVWRVEPLVFEAQGLQFIERYARFVALDPAPFRRLLGQIPSSSEIVTRPLIMLMAMDNLRDHIQRAQEGGGGDPADLDLSRWNVYRVYDGYVVRWLAHEARRHPNEAINTPLKEQMAQRVAWLVFSESIDPTRPYGDYETRSLRISPAHIEAVAELFHRRAPQELDTDALMTELKHRTFLLKGDNNDWFFIHKSFYELFLARFVLARLKAGDARDSNLWSAMSRPLPDEVINFLRGALEDQQGSPSAPVVTSTFLELYRLGQREGDEAEMVRQQAANLLPITADETRLAELVGMVDQDESAFVQRGLAVGIALHRRDRTYLDRFVDRMNHDLDALSVHLGYNRMYYGDQRTDAAGWRDDGGRDSVRIMRASIRQLGSARYEAIWAMSLLTIRVLLADEGRDAKTVLQDQEQRDTLRGFVSVPRPELAATFERERVALTRLLDDLDLPTNDG